LLSEAIKLKITKAVANIVELKTFGGSRQEAQDCALAVFDLIKTSQTQILAPYIDKAKIKLADHEERLQKAKDVVARSEKAGAATGAIYLSTRDEIRYLLDEIAALKNVMNASQSRGTRMVAPIYASDVPIAPKKLMVLAAGLFGGLFLGSLIALARQIVLKLKSASGGVL
jgi:DNA helicase IV